MKNVTLKILLAIAVGCPVGLHADDSSGGDAACTQASEGAYVVVNCGEIAQGAAPVGIIPPFGQQLAFNELHSAQVVKLCEATTQSVLRYVAPLQRCLYLVR